MKTNLFYHIIYLQALHLILWFYSIEKNPMGYLYIMKIILLYDSTN
jgi:hypothetical protein